MAYVNKFFINKTTDNYISVKDNIVFKAEKTVKHFVNIGMDKSAVIDLNKKISKRAFVEYSPTKLGIGKVFSKSIDTSELPIKNIAIK